MHKIFLSLLLLTITMAVHSQSSIYDFRVKSITGGDINFSDFRGKQILIVNIASGTPRVSQYDELKQLLLQHYGATGLIVICFPSNDFNNEKKSDAELQSFFKSSVSNFFVAKKSAVKGNNISPLYEWLTMKSKNGSRDVPIKSDFQKFLINKEGKLIGSFSGIVSPLFLDKVIKK